MTTLDTIPLDQDTIICGDFNARLGPLTGDNHINARGSQLRSWLRDRDISALNATLAYGIPTFMKQRTDTVLKSIIDLFLTNCPNHFTSSASMCVYSDISLGSDHRLVSLTFDPSIVRTDSTVSTDPPTREPRRTWKLSKLKELDSYKQYQTEFDTNSHDLISKLQSAVDALNINSTGNTTTNDPPDLDALNDSLCDAIYTSLDTAIGKKPPRPNNWTKYWTPALQFSAEHRDHCFKKWRRATDSYNQMRWHHLHQQAHKHSVERYSLQNDYHGGIIVDH
jgi:hypothetical protein